MGYENKFLDLILYFVKYDTDMSIRKLWTGSLFSVQVSTAMFKRFARISSSK